MSYQVSSSTENIIQPMTGKISKNHHCNIESFDEEHINDNDEQQSSKPNWSQQLTITTNNNKHEKWRTILIKVAVFLLLWAYFIWATVYYFLNSNEGFNQTSRTGYGFLVILFSLINLGIIYNVIFKPYILPPIDHLLFGPIVNAFKKIKYGPILFYVLVLVATAAYLVIDTADNRNRLVSISGLVVFLLIGFIMSPHKSQIPWHTIIWGMILQFTFGLLTIRWDTGREIFDCVGDKVNVFLGYAVNGSAFVYGDFLVYEEGVFAFKSLATIYFLGFIINVLYYYGVMQHVVASLGQFLQNIMGTSICESVNSAANIFLGMSEAPLLLKPYLVHLTDSEIHSVMTSGFATVSGTVLAAYISFGANPAHLITASVMSAPAALCYSKLMYPETETVRATAKNIKEVKPEYESVLDAATKGAYDASHIVIAIIANLVAFMASIYFVNGVLSWMGTLVGFVAEDELWTVDLILGKILIPVSYVMGVPWAECEQVGQLIGIKTMVNEFAAFQKMSTMTLTAKTKVIATYAICGFSNPGSIGIMISAMSTLMPEKKEVVTRLVFRAFVGGAIVCLMTACIAGMLIPDGVEI